MSKILVIDDEEWLREMVHLALEDRGFTVREAENGARGIEIARKELPDLILCDVNMGQVDGYLTLSSLRSEPATAAIPFILMTGLADNAGMRHGMELGADDYLPKPFTLDALFAAVDARLKKAQAIKSHAERRLADLRCNITMMLPHELRTPLNGIVAYGEILTTEATSLSPEQIREMGEVIYDSGMRLERLVENFLIYAQIELLSTDPQRVDALLQCVTPSAETVIAREARRQADLYNRTDDLDLELYPVTLAMSDDYLSRIVGEVVNNAFKFSRTGTKVTVKMADAASNCTIVIGNRGRGFSPEHISRVGAYMQFDRKMHEQQGLGLGLTIAKRLAELHGGLLSIQSDLGGETRVAVKLFKS